VRELGIAQRVRYPLPSTAVQRDMLRHSRHSRWNRGSYLDSPARRDRGAGRGCPKSSLRGTSRTSPHRRYCCDLFSCTARVAGRSDRLNTRAMMRCSRCHIDHFPYPIWRTSYTRSGRGSRLGLSSTFKGASTAARKRACDKGVRCCSRKRTEGASRPAEPAARRRRA
jgi:hypothetical protein